jgi:transcriptional regulator with XRE-family HTH domain
MKLGLVVLKKYMLAVAGRLGASAVAAYENGSRNPSFENDKNKNNGT